MPSRTRLWCLHLRHLSQRQRVCPSMGPCCCKRQQPVADRWVPNRYRDRACTTTRVPRPCRIWKNFRLSMSRKTSSARETSGEVSRFPDFGGKKNDKREKKKNGDVPRARPYST